MHDWRLRLATPSLGIDVRHNGSLPPNAELRLRADNPRAVRVTLNGRRCGGGQDELVWRATLPDGTYTVQPLPARGPFRVHVDLPRSTASPVWWAVRMEIGATNEAPPPAVLPYADPEPDLRLDKLELRYR